MISKQFRNWKQNVTVPNLEVKRDMKKGGEEKKEDDDSTKASNYPIQRRSANRFAFYCPKNDID